MIKINIPGINEKDIAGALIQDTEGNILSDPKMAVGQFKTLTIEDFLALPPGSNIVRVVMKDGEIDRADLIMGVTPKSPTSIPELNNITLSDAPKVTLDGIKDGEFDSKDYPTLDAKLLSNLSTGRVFNPDLADLGTVTISETFDGSNPATATRPNVLSLFSIYTTSSSAYEYVWAYDVEHAKKVWLDEAGFKSDDFNDDYFEEVKEIVPPSKPGRLIL